ncbi:hypothetical protein RJT34_20706 [Clitoria ternatea]|uniref:Uncharacterized protein n=1 Tax=Clitoria ternatea TaxID=43366 RepID=A0AAN9P627_CLITE
MLPSAATSRFRNFNPIPFRCARLKRYQTGLPRPLGSTNPYANLHRRPLRPGSRLGFYSNCRALLLIKAWYLPQRLGIARAL